MRLMLAALLVAFAGTAQARTIIDCDKLGCRPVTVKASENGASHWRKAAPAIKRPRVKRPSPRLRRYTAPPHVAAVQHAGGLVAAAQAHIGKTAHELGLRPSLWCGAFMALIAPDAAKRIGNPLWARDWATLPRTTAQPGAIGVMARGRRGGHVGVVAGIDARGNVILVSGNHGRRVGIGAYPRSRFIAFVHA